MPNIWSRGLQYLEEKFGAQITKDKDLEDILTQIQITGKGLTSLRAVLLSFNSYTEKFCSFFDELNSALKLIYENTPYYIFIEEVLCKQQIISTHFEDLNKLLIKLYSKTSEWDRIFELPKDLLLEREKKRKIYDHYEKKLPKIQKTSKDIKYIERNEEKYTKAASEYVEISEKIFNLMQDSLKLSWKLANPLVCELIVGEQNLFEGIGLSLSCFKTSMKRFEEIEYRLSNPNSKGKNFIYDPLKYMKEKDLIKQISGRRTLSVAPTIKKEEEIRPKKHSLFSSRNEQASKDTEKKRNLYNILSQCRLTNAFGNISESKLEEFFNIEDDF